MSKFLRGVVMKKFGLVMILALLSVPVLAADPCNKSGGPSTPSNTKTLHPGDPRYDHSKCGGSGQVACADDIDAQ